MNLADKIFRIGYAFLPMARIVVLNGIGSVGKSSTARALQKIANEPFLHVQGDVFLDMISPKMWGHADGIVFEQTEQNGVASVEIKMGSALDQLMDGMRLAVMALAHAHNACIVDDVMLSADAQVAYLAKAVSIPIQFVGLHAPLAVLEDRERMRGDRLPGLAR